MELPGVGVVGGQWDLRESIEDYLAAFPFAGKRVLDVGAARGFPSFEMERRGAEVVSFDMSPDGRWDIVPLVGLDLDAVVSTSASLGSPFQVHTGPPTRVGPADTWWRLSEGCVARMMDVLGLDVAYVTHSRHTSTYQKEPRSFDFFSVVGRRAAAANR